MKGEDRLSLIKLIPTDTLETNRKAESPKGGNTA